MKIIRNTKPKRFKRKAKKYKRPPYWWEGDFSIKLVSKNDSVCTVLAFTNTICHGLITVSIDEGIMSCGKSDPVSQFRFAGIMAREKIRSGEFKQLKQETDSE